MVSKQADHLAIKQLVSAINIIRFIFYKYFIIGYEYIYS